MQYPKDFVERVKKEYPQIRELHEALDANLSVSTWLEREMLDADIRALDMLRAIQNNTVEQLRGARFDTLKRRVELYREFQQIVREAKPDSS